MKIILMAIGLVLMTFSVGIAGDKTGALNVLNSVIEVNPVERIDSSFTYPLDLTWSGAVVSFNSEPIYRSVDDVGLWVMVEYPPVITLDGYENVYDFVNNDFSNVDSNDDKGVHSAFPAQKYGPDSIYDTLIEENTGVPGVFVLINGESFEGSWTQSGWSE